MPTIAVYNAHRRLLDAEADTVGAMIDSIGTTDDLLWPVAESIPIWIQRPLHIGSTGCHGPAAYHVVGHQPRRWIRFEFSRPGCLFGFHEFCVQPASGGGVILQHLLAVRLRPIGWLFYPLGLKPLHDQVIEKLLDNAELATAGFIRGEPVRFTRGVRLRIATMKAYRTLSRDGDGPCAASDTKLASDSREPLPTIIAESAPFQR